jgi:hypothetical protein
MFAFFASLPSAGIGSCESAPPDRANQALTTAPSGKLGADPTIMIVLMFLLFRVAFHKYVSFDLHCSSHTSHISLSSLFVDGDNVEFDLEILASFPECSMSRLGNDPAIVSSLNKTTEATMPTFQAR